MSASIHRVLRPGCKGEDVRAFQAETNDRLAARKQFDYLIAEDGEYGPQTARSASRAAYLLGITGSRFNRTKRAHGGIADRRTQEVIRKPETRTKDMLKRAKARAKAAEKAAARKPLRERAYTIAAHEIGVMETGGNNRGTPYTRYIKTNGGTAPEPWCGDFVAYCYRMAGSKRVSRPWAAVRLIRGLLGIAATSKPQRGDLVRFDFSASGLDHVGMYVSDLGGGTIETIEGNTGASGAFSDSRTGGDGVYRKPRSKSLVHDYLHVAG